MIAAVLDTNVLASAIVGFVAAAERAPARLLRLWRSGRFELVVSNHILSELARTLAKPYFARRLTGEQVSQFLRLLDEHARVTPLTAQVQGIAAHTEDDAVIATAVSGGASYLVTGDAALLERGGHEGVRFISPRAFLELLDATE